jgi:hypothetical protein
VCRRAENESRKCNLTPVMQAINTTQKWEKNSSIKLQNASGMRTTEYIGTKQESYTKDRQAY